MGFDLEALRHAVKTQGRVARVVIAEINGSSPREVGAAMLISAEAQSGTIGGGALEYEATKHARQALGRPQSADRLSHHALGPDLGQCCGGRVTLLREIYDAERVSLLDPHVIARAPEGSEKPLAVARLLDRHRGAGQTPDPQLVQGWMVEPVHRPKLPLWIWGAGHVGRALIDVLAPLPDLAITWVDTHADRFPSAPHPRVTCVPAAKPETLMAHAPTEAHHLILTYSHDLDLALCHASLLRGFASAGVIGSATKWARFKRRLTELGHDMPKIQQIACPIGDPVLGKHPTAIAVGVAAALLTAQQGQIATIGEQRA